MHRIKTRGAAWTLAALASATLTPTTVLAAPVGTGQAPAAQAAGLSDPGGSLVFIRDHDVWIANGDGSSAHRVTRDGTRNRPYQSPSQSDTGVIAVGHGKDIVTMTQGGTVLKRLDPPPLVGPANTPPAHVSISPDGKHIIYTLAAYQCDLGTPGCRPSVASGITRSDRLTPATTYGITTMWSPSWVSNTRVMLSGGYLYQIMLKDLGKDPVHWFDDQDLVPPGMSTDLEDGELSPDGKRLAAVRGYGDDMRVTWYEVTGNAKVGAPPPPPEWTCMTEPAMAGMASPTWAPDSRNLAWEEPDGIWTAITDTPCSTPRRIIPNASQPDWSAARLAPGSQRLAVKKKPSVAGKPIVGRTLSARAPKFQPSATKLSYQWWCDGRPIKGATSTKLRLTGKHRGCRIQVRVTGKRTGHVAAKALSKPTKKVARR